MSERYTEEEYERARVSQGLAAGMGLDVVIERNRQLAELHQRITALTAERDALEKRVAELEGMLSKARQSAHLSSLDKCENASHFTSANLALVAEIDAALAKAKGV